MKKNKSVFSPLANLKTKPSDYRPRRLEEQLTIDNLIPNNTHQETLILKCKSNIPPDELVSLQREFVRQRKSGVIVLPSYFELVGLIPPDVELKVVDDAEAFIDSFLEGKYDK